VIDLREEQEENTFDSMCVNSESVSNEIDESELQYAKQSEQRIRTWRRTVTDAIHLFANPPPPIRVTPSAAASQEKKSDEGTMMCFPSPNPIWWQLLTRNDQTALRHSDKRQNLILRLHTKFESCQGPDRISIIVGLQRLCSSRRI
jgi:hypothetical protein